MVGTSVRSAGSSRVHLAHRLRIVDMAVITLIAATLGDLVVEQTFGLWVLIPITIELAIITWRVTQP